MFNNTLSVVKALKFLKLHNSSINIFSKSNWLLYSSKLNVSIRLYISYINSVVSKYKVTSFSYNHTIFIAFLYLYLTLVIFMEMALLF